MTPRRCQVGRPGPAESGYALIEMLVATAIAGLLLGVLLQFAVRAQEAVRTQADVADVQQRLRVAVETIRRDLLAAGAGPAFGRARGPLGRIFAPLLPSRTGVTGADPELSYSSDRISITYVPSSASESRLLLPMPDPTGPLSIDGNAPACAPGACGFTAGDRVLIFESSTAGAAHEIFTVSAVDDGLAMVSAAAPLSRAYPAGSVVVRAVQRVYYLDRPGKRLMMYDGERSDVPLVDRVADLRFTYAVDPSPAAVPPPRDGEVSCAYSTGPPPVSLLQDLGGMALKEVAAADLTDGPVCGYPPHRFDADLLRVRRVTVAIRLEASSDRFSDLQVAFDVVPRNAAVR